MAEGVASGYAVVGKPPLEMGVRVRLSVMMFLQFAVWGSWYVVFGNYVLGEPSKGGLGFSGAQNGSLYGTMALGAIISTMFAGQLADRLMSSEYIMALFHLVGAGLLFLMSRLHDYNALWWTALAYALLYNPTIAISNSISFRNVPDSTRDFPTLRVLGTFGWIVASMSVDWVLPKGATSTNKPLVMAAILSAVLGLFSVALPHTPPTGKKGDALPFLRAFGLLKDFGFAVFFTVSFVITIALAFYYALAAKFVESAGIVRVPTVMSLGQWSELGFMLLLPFALKRLGMKWVLAVGMGAWALRYGLFSIGQPLALVVLGVILHGVCFDFFLAAGFIHTDNKAPASIRGSAQSLFTFLTYGVGMWIGSVLSGKIVNRYTINEVAKIYDWRQIWMIPAVGAAICLVLFILLWRDKPGKVEEEAAEAREIPVEPVAVTQGTVEATRSQT
jgi:nucleoside transporter